MSTEIRVFKASAGLQWLKTGWLIFKTQPATFVFMYLFMVIVALIPIVAPPLQVVVALAAPFLTIGFYLAVITKQQNGSISLADILKPFSMKGRRLHVFRIGLYQLGVVLILTFLGQLLFADVITVMNSAKPNQDQAVLLEKMMSSLNMVDIILFVVAHSIYLMAFAFALPLVFFTGEKRILNAMKQSLLVFHKNMAALGVFSLLAGLLMLSAIPLSLLPLLFIMPIIYIGFFVSFQSIFVDLDKPNNDVNDPVENNHDSHSGRFDA